MHGLLFLIKKLVFEWWKLLHRLSLVSHNRFLLSQSSKILNGKTTATFNYCLSGNEQKTNTKKQANNYVLSCCVCKLSFWFVLDYGNESETGTIKLAGLKFFGSKTVFQLRFVFCSVDIPKHSNSLLLIFQGWCCGRGRYKL